MRFTIKAYEVLCIAIACAAVAGAAEKQIKKADLPVAVQKTADEQSQGATVRGYSKDREAGKLEYEVQMTTDGHSKDVTIAPDGRLLEVEEEVALDSLPSPVQAALHSKAARGKIIKVESLTKNRSLVAYEAQVEHGSKHSEVQVGPQGQNLRHEE